MRILKENTAALIIDIQEKLFPHIHGKEELAANTAILIRGLQVLGVPLIPTEQYTRGLGYTIPEIKLPLGGLQPVEKTAFSCCDDPGIMERIALTGRKVILLAGIETHVCVLQTAIDLTGNNYLPVVVEDCVSSRKASNKQTAIRRMRDEGALVTSYESILFELARYSRTDEFKAISALVK